MPNKDLLDNIKKLRELTGVGFKDCKSALDETKGDIEKSVELLRKKGIAKASKRMGRTAAEGLVCIYENKNKFSMIEINSETDFVAKNQEFINFAEEVSQLSLKAAGKIENVLKSKMKNKKNVEDNLVDLISKIGEKITLRRSTFFGNDKFLNFSYTHSPIKQNIGKLGVLLSIDTTKEKKDIIHLGKQLAMQVASMGATTLSYKDFDLDFISSETQARIAVIEKENIELSRLGKTLKNVPKYISMAQLTNEVLEAAKLLK